MNWALYAVAAVLVLAGLIAVGGVGKPPGYTTGGQAATIIAVNAAMIVVVVLAAVRLS